MQGRYPFIDIVALAKIRSGFARANAQALFSTDLNALIWINAAGAVLFGVADIYSADEAKDILNATSQRQIASQLSSMLPDENRVISLRLGSQLQQFQISQLILPDGAKAVLLESSQQFEHAPTLTDHPVLRGLDSANSHAALLDANGNIIASTKSFSKAGIAASTLTDLTVEVADAADHILKRRIRADDRSIPGAIIRLEHEPALHLLYIVADEAEFSDKPVLPEAIPVPAQQQQSQRFNFNPEAPITRFVWKVDADHVFTELSDNFAQALGPKAADIIGRRFNDVANVFGLDPHNEIAQLLQSRATWSGRRIMWPAEGTSLHVPVELAALPVFTREREFAGFNGFGVVHIADALPDPEKIGLCLSGDLPPLAVEKPAEPAKIEAPSPAAVAAEVQSILPKRSEELIAELARQQVQQTAKQTKESKPAETATRSESGLSDTERNAFREIADRLRRQGLASQRDDSPFAKTSAPAEEATSEADAPEQHTLPFRNDAASRIERPLLNLPEFNKKPSIAEADAKPAVKAATQPQPAPVLQDVQKEDKPAPVAAKPVDESHMLAHVPFPLILHTNGNVIYANPAFLTLTGYNDFDEINQSGGIDALFNTEHDDGNHDDSMVLRHQDGSEHPVDVQLQSVPWHGQKALMLSIMPKQLAVASAVAETTQPAAEHENQTIAESTQFKDSEASRRRLQTQVEELTSILDTATDGVVLIDNDGLIRSLNHSAAALFGYEETDLRGKNFSVLFAIESQRSAMDYLNSLSDNGVMSVLNDGREVIGREAQGGFIPMFMTLGKLPGSNSFCAVLRDITQWKRAEEELTSARREAEHASGQKTEFLARISHEIRTPLNAIIGFSELMADEKFGPIGNQRYRDYLRDINRSGNHVLTLVNDLLDISKIEAGAQEMDFEAVSLNDAISEAVALMQPQANRERVIIRSSFASSLPEIVADTRSIKQIALNLLSNAVRFTQAGGQVIVSTSYEMNGDVIMRVRDTGVGMDKSEIEQALKPFRQVNNRIRRHADTSKDWRDEGTGLGLPLTKAMVEANRAQLTISSNPGQGTVVEITFPPTRVLAD
ncbi:PAS domain S-box-containing protein [Paenochrobactrum gallinarii]|uniref:histidine kinase n=1 Tax=Paenochrobactrum gallinarii TaxID=643673 RepID=A0A841LQY9_9HYPH|nr:PAS domain S-box protein [Paenochrobactrum gallinarii]MBB6260483.1 PAS domain S-box-containing protein [Paenochrobactrum gallinarii]